MNRPEEALHKAVAFYLNEALPDDSYWFSVPNQRGTRKRFEMGLLKALGVRAGVPDIVILWNGRFIGIELKAPKGQLSNHQKDACDMIIAAGGSYTVARSIDQVEFFLGSLGMDLKARAA